MQPWNPRLLEGIDFDWLSQKISGFVPSPKFIVIAGVWAVTCFFFKASAFPLNLELNCEVCIALCYQPFRVENYQIL